MEKILKLRCPYCDGKVSADEECAKHLAGKTIKCPHCEEQFEFPMIAEVEKAVEQEPLPAPTPVPASVPASVPAPSVPISVPKPVAPVAAQTLANSLSTTMRIAPGALDEVISGKSVDDAQCPYCGEVIGASDRVCISCEKPIPHPVS